MKTYETEILIKDMKMVVPMIIEAISRYEAMKTAKKIGSVMKCVRV